MLSTSELLPESNLLEKIPIVAYALKCVGRRLGTRYVEFGAVIRIGGMLSQLSMASSHDLRVLYS